MTRFDTVAWANRWRRWHPLEKVMLAGGLLALALTLPPWPGVALVMATALGAAVFGARVPQRAWLAALMVPAGFALIGTLTLAGSLELSHGHWAWHWSATGLRDAAQVLLRALAATSALVLLMLTTPITDLLRLLRRVRAPLLLVELLSLTYRLLFVMLDVLQRGYLAQQARLGYRDSRASWRSAALLAVMLLSRALDRGRRLELGLLTPAVAA